MRRRFLFGVCLAIGCGTSYSDEAQTAPDAGAPEAAVPSTPPALDAAPSDAGPTSDPCIGVTDPVAMPACVDDAHGYYVDPQIGADGAAGTKAAPLRTIGAALALVAGTKNRLFLCDGKYNERVAIEGKAVMLWGGFACGTWAYTGAKATIVPSSNVAPDAGTPDAGVSTDGGADGGAPVAPGAPVATTITVKDVKETVVLSDLLLEAGAKPIVAGGSNVGLFAVDTTRVVIQRMFILAGPGADGAIGAAPPSFALPAPTGNDGSSTGGTGLGIANPSCPTSIGGNGGALPAGVTVAKVDGLPGKVAVATPRPPAATGLGGLGTATCAAGGAGVAGSNGADGNGGSVAGMGSLEVTGWVPGSGPSGLPGTDAQGGGGGARIYASAGVGTGGAGGAGGCGAKGGGGGQGGGASIAIAALRSLVELDASSTIGAGAGGKGGRGGNAPYGQTGGEGGAGHASRACIGGPGGTGGTGGGGSGGAGGLSIGVLYKGTPPRVAGKNIDGADQLPGQATVGVAGTGGAEGYPSNFASQGFGQKGPTGIAKAVYAVP